LGKKQYNSTQWEIFRRNFKQHDGWIIRAPTKAYENGILLKQNVSYKKLNHLPTFNKDKSKTQCNAKKVFKNSWETFILFFLNM